MGWRDNPILSGRQVVAIFILDGIVVDQVGWWEFTDGGILRCRVAVANVAHAKK